MAFTDIIDVNKPLGTYRVSTIDDYERETRRHLRDCMMEISGYPYSTALKVSTWTTATRPENPVDGMFGFNTDTGEMEYYDNGQWKLLTQALPDIYDKARKDRNGNVIDTTYATKTELSNATAVMTGATANAAGYKGLAPTPAAGKQASFLRGDGTWSTPTNTTYSTGTAAQLTAGTNSTGQVWGADVLSGYVHNVLNDPSKVNVSGSGYIEFAGGLVFQWGEIPENNRYYLEELWVDFVRDLSACYFICTSDFNATNATSARNGVMSVSLGTQQRFKVRAYGVIYTGETDEPHWETGGKWFAIGKKKDD